MSRVARRQVLFGEIDMPDDPDDMIMHRPTLEQMLDGTYWSSCDPRSARENREQPDRATRRPPTRACATRSPTPSPWSATSDLTWTEKICAMAAAKDGSLQLGFGLGKYPNRNVMDGYAGDLARGRAVTVRASRRLDRRPRRHRRRAPSATRWSSPCESVRFVLEANDAPADRLRLALRGHRAAVGGGPHPHAPGVPGGLRPRALPPDRRWPRAGSRSTGCAPRSRPTPGCRRATTPGGCATTSGYRRRTSSRATPWPGLSFRMIWSPIAMQRPDGSRYGLFLHYQIVQGPGFVHKQVVMGGVEHPDGTVRALRRPRSRADLRPRTTAGCAAGPSHALRRRRIVRTLEIEAVSDTGFHLGAGPLLRPRRPPPRRMARRPPGRGRAHPRLRRPGRGPAPAPDPRHRRPRRATPSAAARDGATASPSSPAATTPSACRPTTASCDTEAS